MGAGARPAAGKAHTYLGFLWPISRSKFLLLTMSDRHSVSGRRGQLSWGMCGWVGSLEGKAAPGESHHNHPIASHVGLVPTGYTHCRSIVSPSSPARPQCTPCNGAQAATVSASLAEVAPHRSHPRAEVPQVPIQHSSWCQMLPPQQSRPALSQSMVTSMQSKLLGLGRPVT